MSYRVLTLNPWYPPRWHPLPPVVILGIWLLAKVFETWYAFGSSCLNMLHWSHYTLCSVCLCLACGYPGCWILQSRLQRSVNWELPDVQAGFRKGRGNRGQVVNIRWIIEKIRGFQKKTCTSASLTTLKPLTMWITKHCRKFLRRWEYQTTLPASWETCMWVKKQQLDLDMEQWTVSKFKKEYIKPIYFHSAYFTYM